MKRINFLLFVSLVLCSAIASASDAVPAAKQKKPIALIGGTIHTVSGGIIENGTILFDKGKISTYNGGYDDFLKDVGWSDEDYSGR